MAGPSEYQVALIIIVGTSVMLMLSGIIVLFMVIYQERMIHEQLKFAIKELCERLQVAANVPVVFHEGDQARNLSHCTQLMIFPVAEELIAIHVTVGGTDKFELIVEDNGMGFDLESARQYSNQRTGLGLFNIENRARVLNATLQIDASKKRGSKITMTMPL